MGRLAVVFALVTLGAGLSARDVPQAIVGNTFEHIVQTGETWTSLSARFGIETTALAEINGRKPTARLANGDVLRVDNRHLVPEALTDGIVINVPQRMLFVMDAGRVAASYPVGLGRADWPTFVAPFTIAAMETDPVWDVPPSIQEEQRRAGKNVLTRVLPGPTNPLGKYWLGLSAANYGIHGTNAPLSIYRFQTHGCVRLHPDDIADLFPRVTRGMPGESVYQSVLMRVTSNEIMLEAHPDVYRRDAPDALGQLRSVANTRGWQDRIDWSLVQQVLRRRDGRVHPVDRAAP
jgi:L,D-transpeptidase ErfK/SrfK